MTDWRTPEREARAREMHAEGATSWKVRDAVMALPGAPLPAAVENIRYWLARMGLFFDRGSHADIYNAAWPPEDIAKLRAMWREGVSATEIGRRLGGRTKNSIISKARRIGEHERPSPIRRKGAGVLAAPRALQPPKEHRGLTGSEALPPFHPIAAAVLREAGLWVPRR
jgi:hypothetical protein